MAKFTKGTVVINVSTKEKGVIIDILQVRRGKQFYEVLINGQQVTLSENNLIESLNLSDPFEKLKRGIFSTYENFLQDTTSFKIQNSSNSNISTLKSSKTLFRAYQFKPLLKLLNSNNRRLLVADEVGLGKTIEAGHIMLELKARRELRNVLIICPVSLQIKWRDELQEKFNLRFKIYESMGDLISDFRVQQTVMAIINYEKIRKPKEQKGNKKKGEPEEQVSKTKGKPKKETLADYLQLSGKKIDLLVCDEAHRARNHETQTYKGVKALMDSTKAALFLTATPIMISRENLFNLLRLLNEAEYSSYSIFKNTLKVNEPFVKALSRLNQGDDLNEIADDLENTQVTTMTLIGEYEYPETATIAERFQEIPLYHMIMKTLRGGIDNHNIRVQLQFDISSLSKMNNIFSRTRKREVTQDNSQAERNPITKIVKLYPDEQLEFDTVIEQYEEEHYSYTDEWGCDVMEKGAVLGLIQRKRQISSSVYAYLNDTDNLEKGKDAFETMPDAKFDMLCQIIDEVINKNHKKLIIFALFRKTLEYLKIRLKKRGHKCIMIHGGVSNKIDKTIEGDVGERTRKLFEFRDSTDINILLSSEVGSEGLDMQFCDALVNYDLPWNPMVVEQRIGRIDRFGQQSPKVNIYNLVIKDSIQEIIYDRLLNRIGIFRDSIGDLEAILDSDLESIDDRGDDQDKRIINLREYFASLEKELYTTKLTKEEQERKTEDVAKAVIREKKHAEEISEKLTNALTNDISFKNEIEKILHRNQYVTEKELITFVQQLIRQKLSTCRLELIDAEKSIYKFHIPKNAPKTLTNFLAEYQPNIADLTESFISFRNKLRDETELIMTFSQGSAYEDNRLMFVNAYHPLILTALEYFKKSETQQNNDTFKYTITTDILPEGSYCLALYELKYRQTKYGVESTTKTLYPLLYDLTTQTIVEDEDKAKDIWGIAQADASLLASVTDIPTELVETMKIDLSEAIEDRDKAIFEDQLQRMESVKLLDLQRAEEFYKSQISHQNKVIRDNEWLAESYIQSEESKNAQRVLPALRGALAVMEEERNNEIKRIKDMSMERTTPRLLSISYLTINPSKS